MLERTRDLPLEVRLSAYLDGQLSEGEMNEIKRLLACDDEAQALLERLKLGSAFGNKAFGEMLNDPVPLQLVRDIKKGPSGASLSADIAPSASRLRSASTVGYWLRTVAVSLAIFVAGSCLGYLVGHREEETLPVQLIAARSWLDDVADYHRIYSRQGRHLAEVPASEPGHIVEWLSAGVGVNFAIPDLSQEKLAFEGARLLVTDGKPTAQLLYRDEDGDIFTICFLKSEAVGEKTEFTDAIRNDVALVSWQKDAVSYAVVGPSSDPALRRIAEAVASGI